MLVGGRRGRGWGWGIPANGRQLRVWNESNGILFSDLKSSVQVKNHIEMNLPSFGCLW